MGKGRMPLHFRLDESYFECLHIFEDDDEDDDNDAMDVAPQDDLPAEIDQLSSDDEIMDDEDFDFEPLGSVNYPVLLSGSGVVQHVDQLQPIPAGASEDIPNGPPGSVAEPVGGPSTDATPDQNQETPTVIVWDGQPGAFNNNAAVEVLGELRAILAQLRGNLDVANTTLTRNENNLNPPE